MWHIQPDRGVPCLSQPSPARLVKQQIIALKEKDRQLIRHGSTLFNDAVQISVEGGKLCRPACLQRLNQIFKTGKIKCLRRALDRQQTPRGQSGVVKVKAIHWNQTAGRSDAARQIGSKGGFAASRRASDGHSHNFCRRHKRGNICGQLGSIRDLYCLVG